MCMCVCVRRYFVYLCDHIVVVIACAVVIIMVRVILWIMCGRVRCVIVFIACYYDTMDRR